MTEKEMLDDLQRIRDLANKLTKAITEPKNHKPIKPYKPKKVIHMENGIPTDFIRKAIGFRFEKELGTAYIYVDSMSCIDENLRNYMIGQFRYIIPKDNENCVQLMVAVDSRQFYSIDRVDLLAMIHAVLHKLIPYYNDHVCGIRLVPAKSENYEFFQVTYNLDSKCISLSDEEMHNVLSYLSINTNENTKLISSFAVKMAAKHGAKVREEDTDND